MSRRSCWWLVISFAVLWLPAAGVPAQEEGSSNDPIQMTASPMGIRRFTPGEWSAVMVQGNNRTDQEVTETISVYFDKQTQYQFARRMWLPPNSMRSTWLPIRAPQQIAPGSSSFEMTLMPLKESGGQEVLRRREFQELLPSVLIFADTEPIKTAGFFRRTPLDQEETMGDIDSDAYELMAIARETAEYSRVILLLPGDFVPPNSVMWQSLDQFMLSGDRILKDSAGLAALRDWLFRGGRLCVFLDRTSPETIAAILGHGNRFQIVDRVELNEFTIDVKGTVSGQDRQDLRRFEQPIELVRVIADGADVQCQVDGWPAAFWLPAGDGEILLLALAPDGWRPANVLPGWESLPEYHAPEYRDLHGVRAIAARFYQPRRETPQLSEVVKPILQEQIGYQIPGRGLATGLLGLNALGLIVGGVWLARRNQLDRLAYLVPVLAGVTAAVFVAVGLANNRSVPTSVAYAQLVRHHPQTDSVSISGLSALYQQETRPLQVATGGNGLLVPMMKPLDGTTQRLVWGDDNYGEWPNVELPAGSVQFASYEQSARLDHHVVARGSFGAGGFEGRIQGLRPAAVPDALVAAVPAPSSGVELRPDGTFRVTPDGVFARGQFLANAVVSDVSRRRQEVFRSLLSRPETSGFATRPTLLVWTDAEPRVLTVPADTTEQGSALAAVPLWIDRTPPGQDFSIPATFIRVSTAAGEQGMSLAYDNRNGKWLSNASRATNTRLRFELPQGVLPCQVREAQLTIRLNAPSRELLVHGVVNKNDVLIRRIENPSGVYQITVDRPEWLSIDERGGLLFTIEITEAEQERARQEEALRQGLEAGRGPRDGSASQTNDAFQPVTSFATWEIDYVRLHVRGTTH